MLTLPLVSSPLLMGLWVLFIAMRISMWLGVLGIRWFGLILFLIYIGGILVIFIYFIAMIPNQRHEIKIFIVFRVLFLLVLVRGLKFRLVGWFTESHGLANSIILFSVPQGPVLILIFVILLVSLLIVVKVTRRVYGPLRPFR